MSLFFFTSTGNSLASCGGLDRLFHLYNFFFSFTVASMIIIPIPLFFIPLIWLTSLFSNSMQYYVPVLVSPPRFLSPLPISAKTPEAEEFYAAIGSESQLGFEGLNLGGFERSLVLGVTG